MKPRILFLYENTGSGHRRVARILESIVAERFDVDVVSMAGNDVLESTSGQGLISLWNYVMRKNWMTVAAFLDTIFTKMIALPLLEVASVAPFHERIAALRPDVIVSTADPFNKGLGSYAAENGIPFVIFGTLTSVNADNVNRHAVHLCYFSETAEAVQAFDLGLTYFSSELLSTATPRQRLVYLAGRYLDVLRCGTRAVLQPAGARTDPGNGLECHPIGPLADPAHFRRPDRQSVRAKLGLDADLPCVLVASGSVGGSFVSDAMAALCRHCPRPMNVLAVCGRDETTYQRVSDMHMAHEGSRVFPYRYVENFDELAAAADCIVTRPSGGVFNECMIGRVPMIAYGRLPGGDRGALFYIRKYGLGEVFRSWRALPSAVDKVLAHTPEYRGNIERFLAPYPDRYSDMADIIAGVIGNALESAGTGNGEPTNRTS